MGYGIMYYELRTTNYDADTLGKPLCLGPWRAAFCLLLLCVRFLQQHSSLKVDTQDKPLLSTRANSLNCTAHGASLLKPRPPQPWAPRAPWKLPRSELRVRESTGATHFKSRVRECTRAEHLIASGGACRERFQQPCRQCPEIPHRGGLRISKDAAY